MGDNHLWWPRVVKGFSALEKLILPSLLVLATKALKWLMPSSLLVCCIFKGVRAAKELNAIYIVV